MNSIAQLLKWYHSCGIDTVVGAAPMNRLAQKKVVVGEHPAGACQTLAELRQAMLAFEGCDLKKSATQLVFADGNPETKVMLIGEAPGAEEDRQGLPFVGLSGQLLDRMFATIGLNRRESLYIANILPWRPPGNRQPTAPEIAACQPFVEKHIALIRPQLLVFLGGVAAKTLLNTTEGIVRLRGRRQQYQNAYLQEPIPAIATFHPAYLLRSPGQKALVWQDLIQIRKFLQNL